MLTLANEELEVTLLDPEADLARLGSRYCSGGYVYQVTDRKLGPLCAGPQYPALQPDPFDGQGLPEVFEIALGQDRARVGDEVLVLGVGRVLRESSVRPFHVRDNPTVTERARYSVRLESTAVTMSTEQRFERSALELERYVRLEGRSLTSRTRVENRGEGPLPLRWFAHPFFPRSDDGWVSLSLEADFADNPGFAWSPDGRIVPKRSHAWRLGQYLPIRATLGYELTAKQAHAALGQLELECRFPLGFLALWGNDRTLSLEPFFHTVLEAGDSAVWSIVYRF
jgi:hypothetical protein